jgi:hypothetical protein
LHRRDIRNLVFGEGFGWSRRRHDRIAGALVASRVLQSFLFEVDRPIR